MYVYNFFDKSVRSGIKITVHLLTQYTSLQLDRRLF
jgi:hypothetical protein